MQKPERSIAPTERLKAFTEEKLVTVTWQTIPDINHTLRNKKKHVDRVALLQRRLNNL